jgi:hypothetical protein
MALTIVITLSMFALAALGVLALVFVIVRSSRSDLRHGLPDPRSGPVFLYARVFRPERKWSPAVAFDPTSSGRISVADGFLRWEPDAGEPWATPLASISIVRVSGMNTFHSDPFLDITVDGSGPWRLVVSDRTINRFMGNDWKRIREARRARDFADLLVGGGARPRLR